MLKTPWRPSVDVNPLFRPLSPKPSDLIMRLAWAKEEGCCIVEIGFTRRTCEQVSTERCAHLPTFYTLGQYFVSVNLFERISVGLKTDFHHLEWIDH